MSKIHNDLVKKANEAIRAVHNDTSVGKEENLESLEELRDECEMLIEALKS